MECALRPSISVWRFHAGWLSCRMKPNKQKAMSLILSDVVYCICFKCEMKCVQCMYIVAKALKIGLKIFTIIFLYCISVVLKTVQIQHKIVNAISHQEYNSQYAPVVVVLVYITLKIFINSCCCH